MSMAKKTTTEPPPGFIPEAEQPYKVPENWRWVRLSDSFHVRNDSEKKIQQKDYLEEGELPIIDQGQIFIGGYTNDLNMKYTGNLPVVIFGDHTRRVKYVDFPFAQGADGIKILLPKDYYLPKAFYYAMQNIYIPNRGYRRHFPLFKNYMLPVPPLPEQQRIVDRIESLFAKLDAARTAAQSVVDEYELSRDAILHRAFTGELTARWRKTHSISLDNWSKCKLSDVATLQTGLMKGKKYSGKTIFMPYLRVANVQDGFLDLSEMKLIEVPPDLIPRYSLQRGDVLFTEGGDYDKLGRGTVWKNEIPNCLHQNHVFAVRTNQSKLIPEFLSFQAGSYYGKQYFLSCSKQTVNLASINSTQLKSFPVLLPDLEEQREIIRLVESSLSNEQQIKQSAETAVLLIDTMKKSILARAFRGELGTNDPAEESADAILQTVQETRRNSP